VLVAISPTKPDIIQAAHHVLGQKDVCRARDKPNYNRLFNSTTEAMQFAARKRMLRTNSTALKTYVGLSELQQLIDMDLRATPCLEHGEGHLAWCLARICALRPSSIGYDMLGDAAFEHAFLAWRDVQVTCDESAPFTISFPD
jgi:hypothetical protein